MPVRPRSCSKLRAVRVALPIVVALNLARLLLQSIAWSAALKSEGLHVGLRRLIGIRLASQGTDPGDSRFRDTKRGAENSMVDRSTPNHHTRIVIGIANNPTMGNARLSLGSCVNTRRRSETPRTGIFGAGRGSRTPKGRSPADFECDAALLQVLVLQHFLQLAFDAATRLVQFGVVSCGPVAHTLRTPIRKLRLRVDRVRLRDRPWDSWR
jgi:hypothetical protein